MRGGKLRYPAVVVREVTSTTLTGADTTDYESILSAKIGITTVSGKEFIEGGAETMQTTVKIVMRRTEKRVMLGDEVRSMGRIYKVMGVLEFDNRRSLQLMCEELV